MPAAQTAAATRSIAAARRGPGRRRSGTHYRPRNLADPPPAGCDPRARRRWSSPISNFPTDDALGVRAERAGRRPPRRATLPDRLVLLGYNGGALELEQLGNPIPSPLAVTPDRPSTDEDASIAADGAGHQVRRGAAPGSPTSSARSKSAWAFRVPLVCARFPARLRQADGARRALARRRRGEPQSTLEELIDASPRSKGRILDRCRRAGRPTTSKARARPIAGARTPTSASTTISARRRRSGRWFEKSDGRWLAEILGLDPAALRAIPFYQRTDIGDARADERRALAGDARLFHGEHAPSGLRRRDGGAHARVLHAPRLGARARSRRSGSASSPTASCRRRRARGCDGWRGRPIRVRVSDARAVQRRHAIPAAALRASAQGRGRSRRRCSTKVSFVGKPAATAIRCCSTSSACTRGRWNSSSATPRASQQLYNRLAMQGAGGAFVAMLIALGYVASGLESPAEARLSAAGGRRDARHPGEAVPQHAEPAQGRPDRRPPAFGDRPDPRLHGGRRELHSLAHHRRRAPRTTRSACRRGSSTAADGAALSDAAPRARPELRRDEHPAVLQRRAAQRRAAQVGAARAEIRPGRAGDDGASPRSPAGAAGSTSIAAMPSSPAMAGRTVGEFIPTVLTSMTATAYLKRQLDALGRLKDRPTAVLERVFAEHLDLCTYRFDAWYGGLLSRQLELMRYTAATPGAGACHEGEDRHLSRRLWLAGERQAGVQDADAGRASRRPQGDLRGGRRAAAHA